MRWNEDFIEEVRVRNDILDVVSGYVRLKRNGGSYFGLCPFHNEKTPSFSVTPSKQMFYCFGCHRGGNVINFVMEYENYTFSEAVAQLAERVGLQVPENESTSAERAADYLKQRLLEIYKKTGQFYYRALHAPIGKKGYEYLRGRGLSDETIRRFGLGYAPVLPPDQSLYAYLKKEGYTDDELKKSSLFRFTEKGVKDFFWNRVMFPILNERNKAIAFGGRVMGDGEPKYLNSQETVVFEKSRTLYGLHEARRARENYMLLCEGYMDVISLHQAGFNNSVAALGTAFNERHCMILRRYTNEVILTFDSDGAGQDAAKRAIPFLKDAGIMIRVLDMKPYKDPDEFIKNLGADAFRERINNARNSFLFEIDVMRKAADLSDPAKKTQFEKNVATKLMEFSDELERNNYTEAVCREFNIDIGSMKRTITALAAKGYEPPKASQTPAMSTRQQREEEARDRSLKAQKVLLTWISEKPTLYAKIENLITAEDFTDPIYAKVAAEVFAQAKNGEVQPAQIMSRFTGETENANRIAELFNTKLEHEEGTNLSRAFEEVVRRVKEDGLNNLAKSATSVSVIQSIMKQRSQLAKWKCDALE